MAPSIPNGFPPALVAGTTWKFAASFGDFPPADGWTVTYQLVGPASGSFVAAPRTSSGDYLVTVTPTDSAAFTVGLYRWTAIAALSGETYVAASGTVDVQPNPAVSALTDARSFAAKQLEKVEAELGARFGTSTTPLGSAHESYTIGGRNITKISIADLQVMRSRLIAEVERERNGGTLPPYEVGFERPLGTRRPGPFRGNY